MDINSVVIPSAITFAITIAGGLIVEYLKKVKPKIQYTVNESVPIEINGQKVAANIVDIRNVSSRTLKDLNISISTKSSEIRNGGIKNSIGLDYTASENKNEILINIKYIKKSDFISITTITEDRYFVQKIPDVFIRSPEDYKIVNKDYYNKEKSTKSYFIYPSTAALAVAATLSAITGNLFTEIRNQSQILTSAALKAGDPSLVKEYANAQDNITYYNQGLYIYSLATQQNNEERQKLKNTLINILELSEGRIAPRSKSSIAFFIGKICLLQGAPDEAKIWWNKSSKYSGDEFIYLSKTFSVNQ